MKRIVTFALIVLTATLQAQTTGETAVSTMRMARSNNWQIWTFASCALATAAGAVFVITMESGNHVSTSSAAH